MKEHCRKEYRPKMEGIEDLRIDCHGSLDDAMESWRELESRGAAPTVYQAWSWVSAWQEKVGEASGARLALVAIADERGPVALWPFAIRREKGLKILSWIGDSHFNYPGGLFLPDFLARLDPAAFRKLWRRVEKRLPRYDVAWLTSQLPEHGAARSPFQWLDRRPSPNSAHRLEFAHHDWPRLLTELRGKKTRKRMRNEESRLSREGRVAFEIVTGDDALPAALEELFAQRNARFRALGITLEPRLDAYRRFYLQLLRASADEGSGPDRYYLLRLSLDDEMLAALLVAEKDGVAYPLINSMTLSRYSRWSPGDYLLRHLIEDACARRLRAIDFGLAEDSNYKTAWCNRRAETYETIRGRSLYGKSAALLLTARTAAARRIKQSPRAWACYRFFRSIKNDGLTNHDWKYDFQRLFRAAGG